MVANSGNRIAAPGLAIVSLLIASASPAATPLYEITQDGQLGWSVASVGDVDGDDVPDFAAGAPGATGALGEPNAGEVRVFSGASGSPVGALVGLLRGDSDARLGRSIAAIGDINDDGIPDIAAGAPANDEYCEDSGGHPGYVAVFSGTDGSVLRRIDGESQAECFGAALAALGDVDGDGIADLLVGAPGSTAEAPGLVYVFSGSDGAEIRRHTGEGPSDNLGSSMTALPDIDGDGVTDYAAGAPFSGSLGPHGYPGLVVVFSGATGAEIGRASGKPGIQLGVTVAAAGAPEGAGGAQLLVGTRPSAPARDRVVGLRIQRGRAKSVLQVVHPTDSFGDHAEVVQAVDDVDGDGRADFVIGGDWGWSLLAGRRALPVLSAYEGNTAEDTTWIARAGDVNGDGVTDLLVGNPIYNRVRLYALERIPSPTSVDTRLDLHPAEGVPGRAKLVVRIQGRTVSVKVKLAGLPPGIYTFHLGTPLGPVRYDVIYVTVGKNGKGVDGFSQSRFVPEYWGMLSVIELSGLYVYVSGPERPTDVLFDGAIPDIP